MSPQNYLFSKTNIDSPSINALLLLRNKIHKIESSIPKDGKVEVYAKKAYDGFHIYDKQYINSKKRMIDSFPLNLNYSMNIFEYDLKSEENLILLINYLKNINVKVTLVLPPYHPDLYQMMILDKPIFVDVENKFRKISQQHNIEIIGSYDGSVVGCKRGEFYDGMHPKEACMSKLFNDFDR
tara:strand:- start:362 stop:907 length:546 start_codon:yes stop_codon:yes gene_type:complete